MKKIGYKHTIMASFTAFVVQAVVNNFAPLLFLTFQAQYGIELSKITVLITANFFIQIFVDLTAVLFVDRIGYRASTVLAHAMCATGLIFMTILPEILPSAFAGLLISVFCYAVGAGLLDITINPIVNSCPSTNSNQLLCLLHSFYCWGSVAAVGISTLFFALFSTANWKIMSLIWAILPIVNAVMFTRVPIAPVVGEDEEKLSIKDMLKTKAFWIYMVLILCAGSSEQAVSQWASTFAEKALGLTKTVGDLAGPMLFSILMGVSRFMYGKFGNRINLDSMMLLSGCVCTASYFLISLTSSPILGLVGVAVCGLSAGILWPGTIGKMSSALHGGGTAMYALLDSYGRVALYVRQVRQQDKSRFNDAPERLRLHGFLFSHFADLFAHSRACRRRRVRTVRGHPLAGYDRQDVLCASRRRNGDVCDSLPRRRYRLLGGTDLCRNDGELLRR